MSSVSRSVASSKAVSRGVVSGSVASSKTVSRGVVSGSVASKAVSRGVVSGSVASSKAVSRGVVSGSVASSKTVSRGVVSGSVASKAVSRGVVSGSVASSKAVSRGAVSGSVASSNAVSRGVVSGSVAPSEDVSRGVVHGASSSSNLYYEGSTDSSANTTYVQVQVQKKLRKRKDYECLSGPDLVDTVTRLIDEKTIQNTFSHLVEQKLLEKVDKLNDNPDEFAAENTEEMHQAKVSQKSRYIEVANIPLKLYVRDLEITGPSKLLICPIGNFLCTDYGAKHVALTVGDVLLEWDVSSLVIPEIGGAPKGEIQDITKYCPHNVAADRKAPHEDAGLCNAAGENEQLFQRTADKKPINFLKNLPKLFQSTTPSVTTIQ